MANMPNLSQVQETLKPVYGHFPLPDNNSEATAFLIFQKMEQVLENDSISCTVAVASTTKPGHYVVAFSGEAASEKNGILAEKAADLVVGVKGSNFEIPTFADGYNFSKGVKANASAPVNVFCAEPKLYKSSEVDMTAQILGMTVLWFSNKKEANPYTVDGLGESANSGTHMKPCPTCLANSQHLVTGRARVLVVSTNTRGEEEKSEASDWSEVANTKRVKQVMQKQGHYNNDQKTGYVKSWREGEGYGFIRYPNSDKDIYFSKRDWPGTATPKVGQRVNFYVKLPENSGQRSKAVKIEI
jgi:cold shock CspA family protein